MTMHNECKKRFWVWVTSKSYYEDEDGNDPAYLDPKLDPTERSDDWWTCHKDTKAGDLILLYRSRPKSDLAFLMEARSGATIWRSSPPGTPTKAQYQKRVEDLFANPTNSTYAKRYSDLEAHAEQAGITIDDVFSWTDDAVPEKHTKLWKEHCQLGNDIATALGIDPNQTLAGEWEGSWVCDYMPRFKLANPIPRADLKADPYLLEHWPALRGNFQQRVYEIPEEVWGYLVGILAKTNPGFKSTVNRLMPEGASQDIISEKELEDDLVENLGKLAPDFNVGLFQGGDGTTGRQYACSWGSGQMGFMDLLCVDRRNGSFLVIELKVIRAGLPAFSQLRSYIGWVKEHLAHGKPVRGLLISDGFDEKFRYAASESGDISVLELAEVRARLQRK
ncbi:endonuclease NucS domain-containing protein [Sulfurisoma sediminicola]|uniref:Uncharacterized protein DUF91 n=1 Tax=Sulfurisoma sediminicola TaxID=1381557 RepID=A0A497XLE0_9PROT|nr:endonuclease NucS domain-containing protein [Sulfurisoma sediminicola]RLJ68210.1 uncharacterized protein DUF91 [Sulfurisoma sediminicola]